MAHRIDGRKFGRKTAPRKAMYANLIVAVLRYEQIKTTEARLPNEPLVIEKLYDEIVPRYGDRNSGYTRVVKIGPRAGDNAPMVQLELV